VEGDAKQAAATAAKVVVAERGKMIALDLAIFSEASRVRSHVQRLDPETADTVLTAMNLFSAARDATVADLTTPSTTAQAVYAEAALTALALLLEKIEGDITRLESESVDAAIASLDTERRILRHREVLSQQLPAVETFVADAAWVSKATRSRSTLNTRPVTDKEKELFGRIVGEGYRKRLADECASLGCDVPVKMQTVGRSGQTLRSLAMSSGHQPVEVLSEGEQKVVAIADFLTEVALNPASAGVIFDDPVNSLNYERKGLIAERLVTEAKARQVIVFTHDLVFLNQLCLAAESKSVDMLGHWIDRDADGRPGSIAAGDLPNTSKVYEKTARAESMLAKAKAVKGAEREAAIREGMGALRTTLEETVVRKVFKDIIPRWSDQVRVTALRKVNWDNAKAEEICALYEDLSRYIEGHSHTDEATGAPAEPKDLETRIAKVNDLIKWAKADRQK
jgi:energy-coupling factor transporter ATP-binding protein EcfA2